MKLRHLDIVIPEENPFANCKLKRKPYADVLTKMISSYSNGFVLSVNNEWGTGKTTFIKMWKQHLQNNGFDTIYFNAWENDFDNTPLVALMSELKHLVGSEDDKKFKSLLKKGAILTKNILPSLIKAVADKYIQTETITEALKHTTEAATEILKDEIEEYAKKKKGLIEFRKELEEFIKSNVTKRPIIFFVDEIDRCRPDYAVEVLEYIKHFFSVKGIVFVLSIDKIQLCNAIKGFYGNDKIDANEYLKRFIDIEYSIPSPSTSDFCKYLYSYFEFDIFFKKETRLRYDELQNDSETFINFSTILFEKENLRLRQQEKIFAHARLALNAFEYNEYVFPSLFVLLVYFREFEPVFYHKISNVALTPEELVSEFPTRLINHDTGGKQFFAFNLSLLLYIYNNYYLEIKFESIGLIDRSENKLLIKTPFGEQFERALIEKLKRFQWADYSELKLTHLIKAIDLTKFFEV